MSTMDGNRLFEAAQNRRLGTLHEFTKGSVNDVPNTLSVAQLEATLALAWEQRTANLIAERDHWDQLPEREQGDGWYDHMDDLQSQINARMDTGPKS